MKCTISITVAIAAVLCLHRATAATADTAPKKWERDPKSPEAKVRVIGKGKIVSYSEGKHITILVTHGYEDGKKLSLDIPQGKWPHLGSVFFEVIFEPPAGYEKDFPVHSPMNPAMVKEGQDAWFALEGLSIKSLQLYQVACRIPSGTPAQFNAVVRNAVVLRETRNQEQIARDIQCRLIESPPGSGDYPDDPSLLNQYVEAGSIFPDRLAVKAPPPNHDGYGKGLKSSDVYDNGVGGAGRKRQKQ